MRKILVALVLVCTFLVMPASGQEKIDVEYLDFQAHIPTGLRSSLKKHEFNSGPYHKLFEKERLRIFGRENIVIIFINGVEITQYNKDNNTLVRINLFSSTLFRKGEHYIEGFPISPKSR